MRSHCVFILTLYGALVGVSVPPNCELWMLLTPKFKSQWFLFEGETDVCPRLKKDDKFFGLLSSRGGVHYSTS